MSPNVKLAFGTNLMIPKPVQHFLGRTIRNVMGLGWGARGGGGGVVMGNFQAA